MQAFIPLLSSLSPAFAQSPLSHFQVILCLPPTRWGGRQWLIGGLPSSITSGWVTSLQSKHESLPPQGRRVGRGRRVLKHHFGARPAETPGASSPSLHLCHLSPSPVVPGPSCLCVCVCVTKVSFKLQRELPNQFPWPEPLGIQYSTDTGW